MSRIWKSLTLLAIVLLTAQRGCVAIDACSILPPDGDSGGIDGREAEPDSRPWVVLIWISCEGEEVLRRGGFPSTLRTCQGSLVRDNWVLTAASCFQCGSKASVIVDIGLHNSDIRTEVALQRRVERIGADAIILHPDHDFSNYSSDSDLAMVRLNRAVKEASRVVSLVDCSGGNSESAAQVGKFGVSSGWGATRESSSIDPKPMQDALLCFWPPQMCSQVTGTNSSNIFCAGAREYSDNGGSYGQGSSEGSPHVQIDENAETCFVERGSPLVLSQMVVRDSEEGGRVTVSCEWRMYGVLLFGMSCEHLEHMPGVFADVCASREWIEETISKEEERLRLLVQCSALPVPPSNGYLCSDLAVPLAGQVEFCCDLGYQLVGSSTAVCNTGTGTWEPDPPTCQPVTCPSLSTPSHAITSPLNCTDISYQNVCWFTCEDGYLVTGEELLTCNEFGEWSHPTPSCLAVDCGAPVQGGNLLVQYTSTHLHSTATYSCKPCFKMAGNENGTEQRHCDVMGKWVGPLPVCEVVRCPEIVPVFHGSLTSTSTTCGSHVRMECDQGYFMNGNQEVICMESGQWNHPLPTCEPIQCQLPNIEDSTYEGTNSTVSFGTQIEVECAPCRKLMGERTLSCQEDGGWDKPLPSCQWVTCPLPRFIDHGTISPLGQLYFCGSTVQFHCDDGYSLVGAASSTCTGTGSWNVTFPVCKEVVCPLIAVPNGNVRQTGTRMGDLAQVTCDSCFMLRGTERKMRCLHTAQWDSPIPLCQRITCPSLHPIPHGSISDSHYECGDIARFHCDPGYALVGPLSISCNETGLWSEQQPSCEVLQCSDVPEPKENSHFCTIHVSDEARPTVISQSSHILYYCCDMGFRMESGHSGAVECGQEGTWNATSPRCHAITCAAPTLPLNGYMFVQDRMSGFDVLLPEGHHIYGSGVTFGCEEGYMLSGALRVSCTAEGVWSDVPPTCNLEQCMYSCMAPSAPENGYIISIVQDGRPMSFSRSGLRIGAIATIGCSHGYYLHGSSSLTCGPDGVWHGQQAMCLPFNQPRSRFISRDPSNLHIWHSGDRAHFSYFDPVTLACQTHTEESGIALPIRKISGPLISNRGVRIRVYGNPQRSTQLFLQAQTAAAAASLSGVYLCQVQLAENTSRVVNRTLTIIMHDHLCPLPRLTHYGSVHTSGTTLGSCHHIECDHGYSLLGKNNVMCESNGHWSSPLPLCVNKYDLHCYPPPATPHSILTPYTSHNGRYMAGDTITYSCVSSHTTVGDSESVLVCLGGNVWSGDAPICTQI